MNSSNKDLDKTSGNSANVVNHYEDDPVLIEDTVQKNISKNVRELHTFFSSNSFITEKNNQKTNIISVSEKRTYFVPNTHTEEFFRIIDVCRKEARSLHYSERQESSEHKYSGIMIDFDRFQRVHTPQLTDRHFDMLTRHISRLLREFLDFDKITTADSYKFHIFYIRKPAIVVAPDSKFCTEDAPNVYKDGFHILIPEIQVTKGFKRFLQKELINRGLVTSTFKDIDHITCANDMLDKLSASNPVHFFGNSKPGKPAY